MSIRCAILGFLSWKPFTGYELKKLFADSLSFHWSGNNNQIYGTLVELHKDGAVSIEVLQQEKLPAKKLYTITEAGLAELRGWLLSEPELPVFRGMAHTQLAWAECLSDEELDGVLATYERQLADQAIMCREAMRRAEAAVGAAAEAGTAAGASGTAVASAAASGTEPRRSEREELIWQAINEHRSSFYESELAWARNLRQQLKDLDIESRR
jgi:PadR family transcriptional regulator, regulatory protein AphA